jgi:hypothetical protein
MTIEVRQLLINASVGSPVQLQDGFSGATDAGGDPDDATRLLREQLLAELKEWLADRLGRAGER